LLHQKLAHTAAAMHMPGDWKQRIEQNNGLTPSF